MDKLSALPLPRLGRESLDFERGALIFHRRPKSIVKKCIAARAQAGTNFVFVNLETGEVLPESGFFVQIDPGFSLAH